MSGRCPFCGEALKVDRNGGLSHSYQAYADDPCYLNGVYIGAEWGRRFRRRHPALWVADDNGSPRFNADGEGAAVTLELANSIISFLRDSK